MMSSNMWYIGWWWSNKPFWASHEVLVDLLHPSPTENLGMLLELHYSTHFCVQVADFFRGDNPEGKEARNEVNLQYWYFFLILEMALYFLWAYF